MGNNAVIQVNGVAKKFCRSLKRSMWYGFKDILRDTAGLRPKSDRLRRKEFWAVDDVSFELREGETLGLIGPNGAGKSTILKMLNGIILPDQGSIRMKGRVSALIQIGAGFHPMLTGRENIYINGAILGMGKREIDKKFDAIVEFADIGDFLNTPVKFYSSGMFVRLGFAVAAHCEPDILLVDEVLAVGDLRFRAKCRKRIQQLTQGGATIIFVSHNLHAVSYLCPRSIVLEKGQILYEGETPKAIDVYRASLSKDGDIALRGGTGEIKLTRFEILNQQGAIQHEFDTGDFIKLRIHYHAHKRIENPVFNIAIYSMEGNQVTGIRTDIDGIQVGTLDGDGYIDVVIDNFNLLPNVYIMNTTVFHTDGFTFYDRVERVSQLKINGGQRINGTTYLPHSWRFRNERLRSNIVIEEECE